MTPGDPDDPVATRRGLAILALATVAAGAVAAAAVLSLPARLDASTDLIGYPTYYDFDIGRYRAAAAIVAIGWPALALVLTIGLRRIWWPGSRSWRRPLLVLPPLARDVYTETSGLTDAAVLGLAAGLGAAVLFDLDLMAVAGFALAGVAALALATGRDPQGLARVVALLAPLGPGLLVVASMRTAVSVVESGATVAHPWFPVWLAAVLAATGYAFVYRFGAERAARPLVMLWTGLPVLWLLLAELPGAIGPIDLFHEGEMLVGALGLLDGRLPWADLHMLHGPWFDAGRALVGMGVLSPDRWGAIAGLHLILNPLYAVGLAALFAWLFGWRWPHAALATLLAVSLDPLVHVRLMLWAPLLGTLALLLSRATIWRALAVVVVGGVQAVLVPEAALAVLAVATTVVLHDAVAGTGTGRARFRRTLLCAATAVPVAAVLVAALAAAGAWDGFLHHLTVFTRDHDLAGGIPVDRDLPFGDVPGLVALVVAALGLVAAVVGWSAAAGRRLDVRDWVTVAASLFALLYLSKVVNRADVHVFHAVAAAAVPIGVAAVRALTVAEAALPRLRALPHLAVVAGLVLAGLVGPYWLAAAKQAMPARWQFGGPVFDPETMVRRLRPTVISDGAYPAVGYARADAVDPALLDGWQLLLEAWVTPGRPVLDLTNRPALFHVLLGYPPVGRFFHVSMALRRESQQALIADLERERPEAVIMPTRRGWDGIPDTVRHYLVSRAVLERYVPVEAFADGVLYVPRGSDLAQPALYNASVACDWGFAGGFLRLEPGADAAAEWQSEPVSGPETVSFAGWAADAATGVPAERVIAVLDGRPVADQVPDRVRLDVAASLNAPDAAASGFAMIVQAPRGSGARVRLLAEFADGTVRPVAAGPEIAFEGDPGAAGAPVGHVDVREIVAHDGVRRLSRPTLDADGRARVRLVLDGGEAGRRYVLADRPPWALREPESAIRFGSPRGGRVTIPVGACPQWWGYGDRPLYLWTEDGRPAPDTRIGRERAS